MSDFFSKAGAFSFGLAYQLAWVFFTEPFNRTSIILRCDPELVLQTQAQVDQAPVPESNTTTMSSTCFPSSSPDMPLRGICQTMKHIYTYEGLWAFWRGFPLKVLRLLVKGMVGSWISAMLALLLPDFRAVVYTDIFDSDQRAIVLGQHNLITWYATLLLANFGISLVSTVFEYPLMTLYVRYVSDRVGQMPLQNRRQTAAATVSASSSDVPLASSDPTLLSSPSSLSSSPAFSSPSLLSIFPKKFAQFGIPLFIITSMMANYAFMTVAFRQMVGDANVHRNANSNEKSATTSQTPVTTDDNHYAAWSQAWASSLSPSSSWVAFRMIARREGYRVLLRGFWAEKMGFLATVAVFAFKLKMEAIFG
ncbi:hypothetical protein BGZ73_000716 [Actinomortierella ambigua]|nr:hypothetical protein BGZ73_000716 [Actinomortierella ambigua]